MILVRSDKIRHDISNIDIDEKSIEYIVHYGSVDILIGKYFIYFISDDYVIKHNIREMNYKTLVYYSFEKGNIDRNKEHVDGASFFHVIHNFEGIKLGKFEYENE